MTRRLAHVGGLPLRFLVAGAANTAFGMTIYPLLLWTVPILRTHYLGALGIAQVVSICFAYMTYKLTVFRTRGNVVQEFGTFSTYYVAVSAANWLVLPLMVEVGRVAPWIVQIGFNILTVIGSFFWHSRLTFRPGGAAHERG